MASRFKTVIFLISIFLYCLSLAVPPYFVECNVLKSIFFFSIPIVSEMDCGDRVCEVEYHLLPNCILYTDLSEDKHCQFPCSTANCATELHNFMMCPIWSCSSKATTTPNPPLSTLSPWPTSSSNCSSTICVPSLVVNGLFGIIILGFVALFIIYRRRNQRLSAFYHSETNPLFEAEAGLDYFQNQRPIIRTRTASIRTGRASLRSSERDPLISSNTSTAQREESNPSPPAAILALTPIPMMQETQF